jgi:hypothetical protein
VRHQLWALDQWWKVRMLVISSRGVAFVGSHAPGPATGRILGVPWQHQPGHGSRVAAAAVSVVARQRRRAERVGGDLW